MSRTDLLEKKAVTGVALDTHMMHVTISYPLPDNQLLTQLFTALEEESVNVDMISQIVNLEGLQLSFSIKDSEKKRAERTKNKKIKTYLKVSGDKKFNKLNNSSRLFCNGVPVNNNR